MTWPPRTGEPLPSAGQAAGIRRKLKSYTLNASHPLGQAKARAFASILGITVDDIDYVETEIRAKILNAPICSIRDNRPHGINCVVEFPLRGIGPYSTRVATLRTVWLVSNADSAPRLATAYIRA